MTLKTELINDVLPLSGSANDFVISGFGDLKAVVITVSGATVDNVAASDCILAKCFLDDTADGSIGLTVQEDLTASSGFGNTNRSLYNALAFPDPAGSGTIDCVIQCSIITNGIRMNVINAPSAAYRFTALLIGGSSVFQAEVVSAGLGNSVGDQTISLNKTWSAAPTFILGQTQAGNVAPDDVRGNGILSYGFSDFTSHVQAAVGTFDNSVGYYATHSLSNTFMLSQTFGGSIAWQAYPHTPTTTNFQVNTNVATNFDEALFLVLGFTAPYAGKVFDFSIAADPGQEGNPSDTVIATKVDVPSYVMLLTNENVDAYDTPRGSVDTGFAITQYDGTLISAISIAFTDAATELAKSLAADSIDILDSDTLDNAIVATPSFSGFNLVLDNTEAPDGIVLGVGFALGTVDSTAAVLDTPTGTKTGHETATGTVNVNDDEGIVYAYPSTVAIETDPAVIKSNGTIVSVLTSGEQQVTWTGLDPSTTYFPNYVHEDEAYVPNQSNVVNGASFTTDPDPTPILHNVNEALPTSGTVDLVFAGMGTPKGILLFISGALLGSTLEDDAVLAMGIMDDTSQGSFAFTAQNAATSNVNSSQYTALAAAPDAAGNAALDFDINGTLITDGVRLSIVNAPAGSFRVSGLLLGGAGVEFVEVVVPADLGNSSGDIAIALSKVWTSAPNLIIGNTGGESAAFDAIQAGGGFSFGFSDFSRHRGIAIGGVDNDTGEYMNGLISSASMLNKVVNDSLVWSGYPHTPTTTNFQFNMSAAGGNDKAAFMAIRLGSNYTASIDSITVPPDNDMILNPRVTAPLFNLAATLQGPSSYDTLLSNADVAVGLTMYDEYEISTVSASVSDSVAKSQHSDSLTIVDAAGATDSVTGIPMFNAGAIEWATVSRPATALLGISLTIGTPLDGPSPPTPDLEGTRTDQMLAFFLANGATTNSYKAAEEEFLIAQGATAGKPITDMWREFFDLNGITNPDRRGAFYQWLLDQGQTESNFADAMHDYLNT